MDALGIPKIDATHLQQRFTEAKVWDVIKSLPPNKAPGGFHYPVSASSVGSDQVG
jgi:hypothetical protein